MIKAILTVLFFAGTAQAGVPFWQAPQQSTTVGYGTGYLSGVLKVYLSTSTAASAPSIWLDGINRQLTVRNGTNVSTMSAAGFIGNLTGNVTGNVTGTLTGNAATASAFAADPSDCSLPNVALGINAAGAAQCAQPSNVTGNAATVTNGVYTNGSYADPSFITSISGSKVGAGLAAANIAAGSLGASVIASSHAVASVQDSAIVGVSGSKISGSIPGNAATATALAADPTDCTLPNVALGVNASGTAVCSQPSNVTGTAANITGNLAASQISAGTAGISVTGNAGTASALAADPTDCSLPNVALGIGANGAAVCAQPSNVTGTAANITGNLAATQIAAGTAGISITGNAGTVTNGLYTSTTFGGDVSGTYNAIAVTDDSHSHSNTTVSSLDESKLTGTFNTANHVVKLDVAGKFPAADGSAITNLPSTPGGAVLASTQTFTGGNTFTNSVTGAIKGTYSLIATTASATNVASLSFPANTLTSSATYRVEFNLRKNGAANIIYLRFNGDSSSSYAWAFNAMAVTGTGGAASNSDTSWHLGYETIVGGVFKGTLELDYEYASPNFLRATFLTSSHNSSNNMVNTAGAAYYTGAGGTTAPSYISFSALTGTFNGTIRIFKLIE